MQANTHQLLMIRPVNFGFNAETARNNTFQKNIKDDVQQQALAEFDRFVTKLRENHVEVLVVSD
ncbi:MAG TPA: arginine deiminase-related protein, partial [Ferruginibacter sp.]|nr:arginine deiminase-related protein [Ferruginibacter sp.]